MEMEYNPMLKNFISGILPAAQRVFRIRNAIRLDRQEMLYNLYFEQGGSMLVHRKILLAGLIVARKYTADLNRPSILSVLRFPGISALLQKVS